MKILRFDLTRSVWGMGAVKYFLCLAISVIWQLSSVLVNGRVKNHDDVQRLRQGIVSKKLWIGFDIIGVVLLAFAIIFDILRSIFLLIQSIFQLSTKEIAHK